jgi:hypothetical protein
MGLDISYYVNAKLAPDAERDENNLPADPNLVLAYVNPDFAERADALKHEAVYAYDDSGGFRAGSYGGYNAWRDKLAQLAGFASADDVWNQGSPQEKPFVPLINFSDCEGIIGPETAARLAKDFAEHQDEADRVGGYFAEKYRDWRSAFEAVAGNGFVDFH